MKVVQFRAVALCCIALLAACANAATNTPDDSTAVLVGPGGGSIGLEGMMLEIPAGALAEETRITVSVASGSPATYAAYSPVFVFGPEGLVFAKPATLRLPFQGDADYATIFWSRRGGPGFERIESSISDSVATALVTHFSEGFVGDERVCGIEDNGDGTKTITCNDGTSATVSDGQAGTSCTVAVDGEGTKTITCSDGTSVTVADGADGSSCTATDNGDGTKTIACSDGTSVVVGDGNAGADGSSCNVTDNGDGTKTIACSDGTSVVVANGTDGQAGKDGTSCGVSDNGDGTKTIACTDGTSVTVTNGADGASGSSCTVSADGAGTKTITCADGTTATVTDGKTGDAGAAGTSCSVSDNGDGTKTIACTDGTSVVVTDGKSGADGASCSVADNGDGTSTITCDDGTSVVVSDGQDGATCTIVANPNGTSTLSCSDGSSVTIGGPGGTSCSVGDNGDGTMTISCPDGTSMTVVSSGPSETVLQGSYRIDNSLDLGLVADIEEITGTLTIDATGLQSVSLPNLRAIGGSLLVVGTTLTALELPALETVGAVVNVQSPSLPLLSLPALVSAGSLVADATASGWKLDEIRLPVLATCGDITLNSVPLSAGLDLPVLTSFGTLSVYDTGLTSIQLPVLATCGDITLDSVPLSAGLGLPVLTSFGNLSVYNTGLTSIQLNAVTGGGVSVSGNEELLSLSIPGLTELSGTLSLGGSSLVDVYLPVLDSVGSIGIMPMAMQTFELPALRHANDVVASGDFVTPWPGPVNVSFPLLEGAVNVIAVRYTGFDTGFGGSGGVETVSFPKVSEVRELIIESNPRLAQLDFSALAIVTTGPTGGNQPGLGVRSNPALTSLAFPLLSAVGTDVRISENLVLTTLSLPMLQTIDGALNVSGNDALQAIAVGQLASVGPPHSDIFQGRALEVYGNDALGDLEFPLLQNADGVVRVEANAVLASIVFAALADVGGVRIADNLFADNTALVNLQMPALATVAEDFYVHNEGLPACMVDAILTHAVVAGATNVVPYLSGCTCSGSPVVAVCP
jgi:hypothetical protein